MLQPIDADGLSIFKLGSTIPVKFKLTGTCAGNPNFIAHISVALVSNNIVGSDIEAISTSAADTGNTFRYDPTNDQYIFNLATKGLSAGTWQIFINGALNGPSGDLPNKPLKQKGLGLVEEVAHVLRAEAEESGLCPQLTT